MKSHWPHWHKPLSRTATGLLCGLVTLAATAGYLVDGSGSPVRSASGSCIRIESRSAHDVSDACRQATGRVVLLPGPDGKAGAVHVRSSQGESTLDTAYAAVGVSDNGHLVTQTESADSVALRYAATLEALPPRPLSFLVYFATGSATILTPESLAVIEAIKAELGKRPAPEITVIGHADTVGGNDINDPLSLGRAQSVKETLVAAGIKASSIVVIGRGEREPLVPTRDDVPELRNRRVEINLR